MDNAVIIKDLKIHLVTNYKAGVEKVILFGSQVYGKPDDGSDYDVLVILRNDFSGKDENQILDLCCDINLKYNILLDVHVLSKNDINSIRGKQPIFINALKKGMYV